MAKHSLTQKGHNRRRRGRELKGLEQQVRQVLKSVHGKGIACSSLADLVHYDKVLKVFFIPVWRWPGKKPLLHCPNCNHFFHPPADHRPNRHRSFDVTNLLCCGVCNCFVHADFRYYPLCGSAL